MFRRPNLTNAIKSLYRFDATHEANAHPRSTRVPLTAPIDMHMGVKSKSAQQTFGFTYEDAEDVNKEPTKFQYLLPRFSTTTFLHNTTQPYADMAISTMFNQFQRACVLDVKPANVGELHQQMILFARYVAQERVGFSLYDLNLSNMPDSFLEAKYDPDRDYVAYQGPIPIMYIARMGKYSATTNINICDMSQNDYRSLSAAGDCYLVAIVDDPILPVQFFPLKPEEYVKEPADDVSVGGKFKNSYATVRTLLPVDYDEVENCQLRLPLQVGGSEINSSLFDPMYRETKLNWRVQHDASTSMLLDYDPVNLGPTWHAIWDGQEYEGWGPVNLDEYELTSSPKHIGKGRIYVESEAKLKVGDNAYPQYHCFCPYTGCNLVLEQLQSTETNVSA